MGRQSEIFLNGEGLAWLKRNQQKISAKDDPVLTEIKKSKISYRSVLEIGCANGWRLDEIFKLSSCKCVGIDPCIEHTQNTMLGARLLPGTADAIPLFEKFDMIVFGFCLYLCDPEDYFKIAMESDRLLNNGGYLIIYDFYSAQPYARKYSHAENVLSRKMDFSEIWSAHPYYHLKQRAIIDSGDDRKAVVILQKNSVPAFPLKE